MKKAVRILCAVFAALIVLCHFCVFAGVENGEAIVVFDTVSGVPGQSVEMNVHLTRNPGITGLLFRVSYDKNRMSLESAEYTSIGRVFTQVNIEQNPFVLLWNVATSEFTETGVLVRLKFKIHENVKVGEIPVKVSYGKGDCIDYNLKDLDMDITEGKVKVLYDGTNCEHVQTEKTDVSEPSCTKLGKYELRCKKCSTLVGEGSIPFAEHKWGSFIVKKEPSFSFDGYKEKVCGECGDTVKETIPKLEHGDTESLFTSSTEQATEPLDTCMQTTSAPVGSDTPTTTENPATGDETWILLIVACVSAVMIVLLILKRVRDKRKADPMREHKKWG